IAFLNAPVRRGHPKIWIASAQGGVPPRLAVDGLDLIPTRLAWPEDGRALYFESGFKGATHLFRADLETRRAVQVTNGDRTLRLADINEKTHHLAYGVNDPVHMDDLYIADMNGQNERQLTHLNDDLWKQVELSSVERVPYKGADG